MPLPPYNDFVTLDEKIAELEYEVKMRESAFPRWAEGPNGKDPKKLAKRLAIAKAILEDYRKIKKANEGTQISLF